MTDLRQIAPGLCDRGEGRFGANEVSKVSYPDDGNDGCRAVEDSSFWFAHRNAVLLQTLKRFAPPGLLIDVGGGNGHVTRALLDAGHEAALLEPGAAGIANAHARGVRPLIQATLDQAEFLAESVPAFGLLDVVEHVEDDRAFLATLRSALIRGGRLYVTVPAFGWLWSHADAHAGHFRRYSLSHLRSVLTATGFVVDHVTCFFSFLAPPVFFAKTLPDLVRSPPRDRQRQSEQEHQPPRAVRTVLDAMGKLELNWLQSGRSLGVGSSVLAVAHRP